jgi:hypothetical protein
VIISFKSPEGWVWSSHDFGRRQLFACRNLWRSTEHPSVCLSIRPRLAIWTRVNKTDLAHWKSCLLDKGQETELAAEFRKYFGVFEF